MGSDGDVEPVCFVTGLIMVAYASLYCHDSRLTLYASDCTIQLLPNYIIQIITQPYKERELNTVVYGIPAMSKKG